MKRQELLDERNKTCILFDKDEIIYESTGLGVKPLRQLRQEGFTKRRDQTLILVDRVIGKGALMLAMLLGVVEIHTPLLSQAALDYNAKQKEPLKLYYETLVPYILNRDQSGLCPIEQSVKDIDDPHLGEKAIEEAIAFLMAQNS